MLVVMNSKFLTVPTISWKICKDCPIQIMFQQRYVGFMENLQRLLLHKYCLILSLKHLNIPGIRICCQNFKCAKCLDLITDYIQVNFYPNFFKRLETHGSIWFAQSQRVYFCLAGGCSLRKSSHNWCRRDSIQVKYFNCNNNIFYYNFLPTLFQQFLVELTKHMPAELYEHVELN